MSDTQQYWVSAHRRFSGEWAVMTFYERFEQVVALILANVIAVVVVISLFQLIRAVLVLLAGEASTCSITPRFRACSESS